MPFADISLYSSQSTFTNMTSLYPYHKHDTDIHKHKSQASGLRTVHGIQ